MTDIGQCNRFDKSDKNNWQSDGGQKGDIMIAYLTSHIGGSYKQNGTRIPTQLNTENGLLDSLKKH